MVTKCHSLPPIMEYGDMDLTNGYIDSKAYCPCGEDAILTEDPVEIPAYLSTDFIKLVGNQSQVDYISKRNGVIYWEESGLIRNLDKLSGLDEGSWILILCRRFGIPVEDKYQDIVTYFSKYCDRYTMRNIFTEEFQL